MSTIYIGYQFTVQPLQPATDILMAELSELGFESFVEQEDGFVAYIQKQDWNENILEDVYLLKQPDFNIKYHMEEIAPENWNQTWESNFNPINIDNQVYIRAPFHEKSAIPIDLLIEPKMSFGTGHHETTHLMVQHLLQVDLNHKEVLDMGCGTAVLAILAEKLGATKVDAIDIDFWSYENSLENIERNHCQKISVYQGDATLLQQQQYDVIIANINRNILLQDMENYVKVLKNNGLLLLSGFYTEDIPYIEEKAMALHLQKITHTERNNWVGMRFEKY